MLRKKQSADTLSHTRNGVQSAKIARQDVEDLLSGRFDLRSETVCSAVLATSELVTNAMTAAGECDVRVVFVPTTRLLRVEVTDKSVGQPHIQPLDSTRVGGHGLRIVEAVTARWGVSHGELDKTVWFEIVIQPDVAG